MSKKSMVTSVLLALVGVLLSSTVQAENGDSANILSIAGLTHPLDRAIAIGQPFTFIVTVQYSLGSPDVANLNVYVEEYPKASGCGGSVHRTNGGSTTTITRGSGRIYARVTWNGYQPVYAEGGFLRIGVTFSDPNTQMDFRSFPMSSRCFRFF
jgi:hypothetical protein